MIHLGFIINNLGILWTGIQNTNRGYIEKKLHLSALKLIFIIRYLPLIFSTDIIDAYNLYWRMGSLKHGTPKTPHFNSGRTRTRPCVHCGVFFFDNEKLLNHERSHEEDKNGNDQKTPHFNSGRTRQSCNEDSSNFGFCSYFRGKRQANLHGIV